MNNLTIKLGLVAFLVCVGVLLMAAAQDTNDTDKTTRYVTGCVQQGQKANDYHLITENAKWHLKGDSLRLADYVGHKVKVPVRFQINHFTV